MAFVNKPNREHMELALEKSSFSFFITGSNFFGGKTPESDLDYFVQDSPEVRAFLTEQGFNEDFSLGYADHGSCAVFAYKGFGYSTDIHVQVVKDAGIKNTAQIFLQDSIDMRSVPKEARQYLWNLALTIACRDRTKQIESRFSRI